MQPHKQESLGNTLFERVIHYDSPQPSPAIAPRRMRFRSSVAPSPPTSHKSESTERLQQQHGNDDHKESRSVASLAIVPTSRPHTSSKKREEVRYKAGSARECFRHIPMLLSHRTNTNSWKRRKNRKYRSGEG